MESDDNGQAEWQWMSALYWEERTMMTGLKRCVPRKITVKTVDGMAIKGKVNLGMEERVSDLFTKVECPFLIMFDIQTGGQTGRCRFINKHHIIWAEEDEVDEGAGSEAVD